MAERDATTAVKLRAWPRGSALVVALVWSAFVLWLGGVVVHMPIFTALPSIFIAFLAPGSVLAAMVLAERLGRKASGRAARAALRDMLVALALWPGAALLLGGRGPGLVTVLGLALAAAHLALWAGTVLGVGWLRRWASLAALVPSLGVAAWAGLALATGAG